METTNTTTTTNLEEKVVSTVDNTEKSISEDVSNAKTGISNLISRITSFRLTKLEIILAISLFGIIIFLCFFKTNTNNDQVQKLQTEIKTIQKQKDSVVNNINNLAFNYKKLQNDSIKESQKMVLIDQKLNVISQNVASSIQSVTKQKAILDSINKKIDKQTIKPQTLTGDDLLNSLKSKIN